MVLGMMSTVYLNHYTLLALGTPPLQSNRPQTVQQRLVLMK